VHPTLRAFRSRNFRIFYIGQFVSVLGSWMQTVATAWLVYRLSGSAFLLGLTAFVQQAPLLFISSLAGVLADRVNRRQLLVVVQSLACVQSLVLAILTFTGHAEVWAVIACAFWLGLCNAFETPTRQAFLLDLVHDRSDLPNAIALQSFIMNSTRFIGPSIAGLLLAAWGEWILFALNAVSYLAIVAAYLVIRTGQPAPKARSGSWWEELLEGFRYAYGRLASRRILLLLSAFGILTAPWQNLLPIFAAESFGGDSRTFGFLIGSVGFGAIAGTLYLAGRASVRGLGRIICVTALTAAVSMMAFAFTNAFWQALVILPVFGFGVVTTIAACNSILQTIADDHMRGRVVAIYVMSFLGIAPLGNLIGGAVAEAIGAHWTFFLNGALLAIVVLAFIRGMPGWRRSLRSIYTAKGIIGAEE
jgi:MFS family permease